MSLHIHEYEHEPEHGWKETRSLTWKLIWTWTWTRIGYGFGNVQCTDMGKDADIERQVSRFQGEKKDMDKLFQE